jgi:LysM repeat protein
MTGTVFASRPARVAAGLGALIALTAVIVGVPTLLVTIGAIPHDIPTMHHVWVSLTSRDNGQLLGVVLAAGVWICWALFVIATIPEVVCAFGRRPTPRLPGLAAFQRPAAALITAIVFMLTVTPIGMGKTAVPTAGAAQRGPTVALSATFAANNSAAPGAARSSGSPVAGSLTYTVQRHDSLWKIAASHLGNPLRYHEIKKLNPGRIGAENEITPGMVLVMPPDATGLTTVTLTGTSGEDVTVDVGDTLSGISTDHGVDDWHQVWQTNADRSEPGGATFTDPGLIRPGWTITIPGATVAPGPNLQVPTIQPPTRPEVPGTIAPPTDGEPSVPTAAATQSPSSDAHSRPDQAEAHSPIGALDTPEHSPSSASSLVAFAGGGALLAGVLAAALMRHRRRQFRLRPPGHAIAPTPPDLVPTERALLVAGHNGTADMTWLNQALRGLVHTLSATNTQLPDVVAASMTDEVLELVLTRADLPAPTPWQADESGTRWRIRRDEDLKFDQTATAYHFAPFPTLASVGYTDDGQHWLLDLERIGSISIAGEPERCLSLARFLAAELAHNVWSESIHVTLVGFGAEMAELNPERITRATELDQAITKLTNNFENARHLSAQSGIDVLESRRRAGVIGDGWTPHVVLVAQTDLVDCVDIDTLLEAMRAQPTRTPVALVFIGDPDRANTARWQLTIDGYGKLYIPALELTLTAHQLPSDEAADLAALLAMAAEAQDSPMPAADGDQPWDAFVDIAGALLPELTMPRPDGASAEGLTLVPSLDAPHVDETAPLLDSVLPLPTDVYVRASASTNADVATIAPVISAEVRHKVEDADPGLDADLAAWADQEVPLPKLSVLGPISLSAQGTPPPKRLAYYTEVITYLATRPHGATAEELGSALHPGDPDIREKTTARNAASVARSWLGTNPRTGREHLLSAAAGRALGVYVLQDVLWDAELFRRLRVRGLARGASGIEDLWRALNLVTGVPFDRQRPQGYSWLVDASSGVRLDFVYAAMIVDVAHTLATHHLGAGQPEMAFAAAQSALKAGASDDIALLDLVAACDALDRRAEADQYVAAIIANHDGEDPEDLPPRTYDVLRRRQFPDPDGSSAHRSSFA